MKSIKRQKNKKLITLIIIVVSALLIYTAAAYVFSLWPFNDSTGERVNNAGISTIDDSNDAGKEPVLPSELPDDEATNKDNASSNNDNTAKKNANVGLAFASVVDGNLEVRAFTTSEIKGDATCTAIATNGAETVEGSSKSFVDATTSQCHPILIPLSEFKNKSGSWRVSVKYESNNYSGQSPGYEVNLNES